MDFGVDAITKTDSEKHVFEVQVYFDDLDPEAVRVEFYVNGVNGAAPERLEMRRGRQLWWVQHAATPIV